MPAEPTVFVVDDDEAVRDSLASLLEAAGHTVETFASARAFLDAHASRQSGCLVVDIRMPDMDGLTLQERLAAEGARLPVIVVTGHGDVPLAVRAMKAGALDFIEKPFMEDAILQSVARALALAQSASVEENAAAGIAERLAGLTPREREVFDRLMAGKPNKVIAYELAISPRTVETHRARVMDKMQAQSLSHLVRMALQAGSGA